ncbi:MAG: hypothetical protein ABI175_29845 [Polyangiales bacterium]
MTTWVYLLTGNTKFPDPLAEARALYECKTAKQFPWLLLADTKAPPLGTAQSGDTLLLCTRPEGFQLFKVATATVWQPPRERATPESVAHVYGQVTERRFVPLSAIELHDPPIPVDELTEAEQQTFRKGQAFARKVPPER